MQRVIGIDFGTSTTYMNVKRYNGNQPIEGRFSYLPVVFNYGESSGFVVSVARENADGSFDFGEKAEEQLEGAKIYREMKMSLESSDEQERSNARRITKEFFKYLHETYSQQAANFGNSDDVEETIISYPVKWKEETIQFMTEAAREAGFLNVRGMDEASAAVMAVLCQNPNSSLISAGGSGYLMMIDMGAGTTDLVICKYQSDENSNVRVELVSSWPVNADEPSFGGREVDAVLEKYVENYLAKALSPELAPKAHVMASAPGQAKMWKERNVSVGLAAKKQINTCAYIGTYKMMGMLKGDFPTFGRTEFEEMAKSCLNDYVRLILGCLTSTAASDTDFSANGLDLVILTGGHSSWYFAREIIDGTMDGYLDHSALSRVCSDKSRVVNLPNPQITVSLGLVYSKLPFRLTKNTANADKNASVRESADRDNSIKTDAKVSVNVGDDILAAKARRYIEENGSKINCFLHKCHNTDLMRFRVSLNTPPKADIFLYHDDSAHTTGQFGFALTETGIYTTSPKITWTEFTNGSIDFGSADHNRLFVTTEDQTKLLAIMSTLTEDQQIEVLNFMRSLQDHLRKLADKSANNGGNTSPTPVNNNIYADDRLPSAEVFRYIEENGSAIKGFLHKSNNIRRLCFRTFVSPREYIFLHHDDSTSLNGESGFVITGFGINARKAGTAWHMIGLTTWSKFINGSIDFDPAGHSQLLITIENYKNPELLAVMSSLTEYQQIEVLNFMRSLQAHLRELGYGDIEDTGGTPASEKKFANICADDRLLAAEAKRYIQDNRSAINDVLWKSSNLSWLRFCLGIPSNESILLHHDTSIFSRGANGFALTEGGIYCKEFLERLEKTTWEEFIKGKIYVSCEFSTIGPNQICLQIETKDKHYKHYTMAGISALHEDDQIKLLNFMLSLQDHLRQRALENCQQK